MRATAFRTAAIVFSALTAISGLHGQRQQPALGPTTATVPRLIRFSGTFVPANGLPPAPVESATLAIFREQQGGTPLWQETQNVDIDQTGHYTVLLGSTENDGIPVELFASEEPRWLSIQFNRPGEAEQARVRLVSVPYALKAADAETLGGLPASAYMRTQEPSAAATESLADPKELKPKAITGTPTTNSVVKFTDAAGDTGNSIITDNGSYVAVAGQAAMGSGHASQTYGFDLYVNGNNPTELIDSYGIPGAASLVLQGRSATGASNQALNVNSAGLFSIIPSGTSNPALSITQTGNIGMGTSAPASKLAVSGQAAIGSGGSTQSWGYDLYVNGINPTVLLDAYGNPGTASLTLQGRAANVYSHRLSVSGTGLFSIAPSSSGTAALSINQSGNVGIGTSSAATKLEIAGTLKLDGTGNGIIFPDGTQQTTAAGGGSPAASGANTQAIALLRWYNANLTTQFATGANPSGIAFDGSSIWVANATDNTVSKLANTGAILGTFAVGAGPQSLAFDGANIWVANYSANTVTELRASDGATLGTFSVGANPCGVAFDGSNLWVTNFGSNNVTKLAASTGMVLGSYTVGTHPCGIAFDGANVWVANYGSNNVTELQASSGAALGTFPVGTEPRAVTFDGANMWVANYGSNNVSKLLASNGTTQGTFPVGTNPCGTVFDGVNIWVMNSGSNTVSKLLTSSGALEGTFPVGLAPNSAAFDGANIWVTNSSSNTVNKL